jgi:hypothetical protein
LSDRSEEVYRGHNGTDAPGTHMGSNVFMIGKGKKVRAKQETTAHHGWPLGGASPKRYFRICRLTPHEVVEIPVFYEVMENLDVEILVVK